MICYICGQQMPENAQFCSKCGAKLFEVKVNKNINQKSANQTDKPEINPVQDTNQDAKQPYQIENPNQNSAQSLNQDSNQNQGYQNKPQNISQGYQIPRPNQYQAQNPNQGFQNPYPNQNQGQVNDNNSINTFALAGFILGIVSIVFGMITFGVTGICAIVFSSIALSKSKTLCSRDMAFSIIGLVLSIISIILSVMFCIFIFCV